MANLKLHIDEFDEIDYQLLAIHTTLEDYRLAFLLNQKLGILLQRCPENISITNKNGTAQLARFVFDDEESNLYWNLIQNKSDLEPTAQPESIDLFASQEITLSEKSFLVPEYKNVDFFLQIQNCFDAPDAVQNSIQEIMQVALCYTIDTLTLKSRNNLIF